MKKYFASNNLGFSLITAIAALAVVTATTAYLMNLSHNSSVVSASAKATTYLEAERSRISTALANNKTCMLDANFGGGDKAPIRSITVLYTAVPPPISQPQPYLIQQGSLYYDNTLRIDSIRTRAATLSDSNSSDVGTAKGYVLEINYVDTTIKNKRSAYTGKKTSIITIPMYMKVVSGFIVECYSLAQNNNVDMAIKATCSPNSSALTKTSLLNSNSMSTTDCEHKVNFSDTTTNTTTCTSTASVSTSLSGWDLTPGVAPALGSTISIPDTKCSGIDTVACTATYQASYGITSNNHVCSYPGGSREGCSGGQLLYHSGSSASCVSIACSGAYELVNSMDGSGAHCITPPATTCTGTNEYVKEFKSNGADVCGILPTMSGTCSSGQFGTSFSRDSGANGTLNCTAYNKSKACPSPSPSTFATTLGVTATCTTF